MICASLLVAGSAAANNVHAPPPSVSVSKAVNITENDRTVFLGALNLEYLEVDYFLWAAFGYGLDTLAPGHSEGGLVPIGVQIADLEPYYTDIFMQIGRQEIGHVRLLAIEAGQNAIIRNELHRRRHEKVVPCNYTTTQFTTAIANLGNTLSHEFVDEGVVVPKELGADEMITGNILAADANSAGYTTTPAQLSANLYMTGDPGVPGGLYPDGASGVTAQSLLC